MTHAAAPSADREPRGEAFDRRLIAPMILGAILNPINSSIIAVSLVPIGRAFGAPVSQTAWLVSALYLATAIGQPVVGRLVETYGARPLFLGGTALVGIAGVIGTVAPSLGVLVGARVILGFGTCAGYPAAMYLIRSEAERTGRDSPATILTILSVSTQTIAVIGPTLGGLLIGLGGWRLTLAVNIPLAIAGLAIGVLRLPTGTSRGAEVPRGHLARTLDLAGMALFAVMLTSLLLFLMSPKVGDAWLVAITVAAAVAFGARERRAAEPFIDLQLLGGNPALVATYVRSFLTMVISYCFLYGFTQWLQDGRGLSASAAGLILLPLFGMGIVVTSVTGRHPQVRGKLLVGGVAQLVTCVALLFLQPRAAIWLLVVIGLVLGIPQGLNNLANQNAVYRQADPARIGSSAGLLRTFGYLGAIAASTAGGAFFGDTATTGGLHHLAVFMVVTSSLFLALTALDPSLRDRAFVGSDGAAGAAGAANGAAEAEHAPGSDLRPTRSPTRSSP